MGLVKNRTCTFEDCIKKHDSHGFCSTHAFQYRKYGHPLTKEEKHENHSKAAQARLKKYGHHNLGKRWTLSEEKKNKKGVRLNTGRTHFKKGITSWNKGTIGIMKSWNKGKTSSPETKAKISKALTGRVPWNKIGEGITPQSRLQRQKFSKTTQHLVFQRDNYTCQFCDQHSGYLQVDHIKSWAEFPELRFQLDNCRTLCMACHYYVTFKKKLPEGVIWGHNLSRRIES